MSDWHLRLARPGDAAAMLAIELAAGALFRDYPETGDAGTYAIPEAEQRRHIARGHCLLATVDDAIVGFITCRSYRRELDIVELDVHPAHQRRGIGGGLLRAALIDARNCGFRAVTLTTFRNIPWNAPFYARHGFGEISDLQSHARLSAAIAREAAHGLPEKERVAMIAYL